MKISIVAESFGAGVLTVVRQLSLYLHSRGHLIQILHGKGREELTAESLDFPQEISRHQTNLVRHPSAKEDFRSIGQLLRHWNEFRPDIVHLFSSKAGVAGRLAAPLCLERRPVVFYSPQGFSFLNRSFSKPARAAFYFIEALLGQTNSTLIAASKGEFAIATELTGLERVVLIPNGVEVDGPQAHPGHNEECTVVSIGRAAYQKSPETFAEAARLFPAARWIWIGDGPDRETLSKAGVHVTGWINRDRVRAILSRSDFYVQASRWEGLPLAVLEAMAAGLPILATPVVGNQDLVFPGQNGYFVDTAADIVRQVRGLHEDRTTTEQLGKKSREIAMEHYSLEQNMHKLLELYEDTLGAHN